MQSDAETRQELDTKGGKVADAAQALLTAAQVVDILIIAVSKAGLEKSTTVLLFIEARSCNGTET